MDSSNKVLSDTGVSMNREIKFKIRDNSIKDFLYEWWKTIRQLMQENIRVHSDCIFLQYTWLKDSDWVEIYEGDILWFKRKVKEFVQVKYYDDWYKCSVRTSPVSTITTWLRYFLEKYNCYISWNIYQNHELLSEK